MMIAATPPAAPPAMAPVFGLPPELSGGTGDVAALEADVGVVDWDTLEGLKIEPGPSSGESIKSHRVRPQRRGK
jgi:hypothetical protein